MTVIPLYYGSTMDLPLPEIFPGIQSLHPKVLNSLLHQNLLFLYLFVPLVPFLRVNRPTKQTNPKSQRTNIAWAGNPINAQKKKCDLIFYEEFKTKNFVTKQMVDLMCCFLLPVHLMVLQISPRRKIPSSMTPCSKRCSSACAISWCLFFGDRYKWSHKVHI